MHAVAAVGDLGDEVAPAPHLHRLAPRGAVAAVGGAEDGVALHGGAHAYSVERVYLRVVEAQDAGRQVVVGADYALAYDVEAAARGRLAQFVVEVGAHRRAAVAREPHAVAPPHGPRLGPEVQVDAVGASPPPFGLDMPLDVVAEALQVAVDGRRAVGEGEIEGPPVAAGCHGDARDVAVVGGHQGLALRAVGLDVDARVEVARAHLAEVGRIETRCVAHGESVVARCGGTGPAGRGGEEDQKRYSSHGSSWVTIRPAAARTAS